MLAYLAQGCSASTACAYGCECDVEELEAVDDFDALRAYVRRVDIFATGRGGAAARDVDIPSENGARLRYARAKLDAPADEARAAAAALTREEALSDAAFRETFERVVTRRGWSVRKYGRGKALRRCLKVERGRLGWGSRKADGADRDVPLDSICDVSIVAFDDAPAGEDPARALCFNVANRAGLKIMADSATDAIVLSHGFGLLCEEHRLRAAAAAAAY